jgi:hypothetical protein
MLVTVFGICTEVRDVLKKAPPPIVVKDVGKVIELIGL